LASTAKDWEDVVSAGRDDVVKPQLNNRRSPTEGSFLHELSALPCIGLVEIGFVGIESIGHAFGETGERARYCKAERISEPGLNIAESISFPPRVEVVIGPDNRIEGVEQVLDINDDDDADCGEVLDCEESLKWKVGDEYCNDSTHWKSNRVDGVCSNERTCC